MKKSSAEHLQRYPAEGGYLIVILVGESSWLQVGYRNFENAVEAQKCVDYLGSTEKRANMAERGGSGKSAQASVPGGNWHSWQV